MFVIRIEFHFTNCVPIRMVFFLLILLLCRIVFLLECVSISNYLFCRIVFIIRIVFLFRILFLSELFLFELYLLKLFFFLDFISSNQGAGLQQLLCLWDSIWATQSNWLLSFQSEFDGNSFCFNRNIIGYRTWNPIFRKKLLNSLELLFTNNRNVWFYTNIFSDNFNIKNNQLTKKWVSKEQ